MPVVTHLKNYLFHKDFNRNPERLLFYNYLCHFCLDNSQLNNELLNQFYRRILLFPYWQVRLKRVLSALMKDLSSFATLYSSFQYDEKHLFPKGAWQIIKIQKEADLVEFLDRFMRENSSSGDQVQVLPLSKERVAVVLLKFDGRLKVMSFGPLAFLHQGKLYPLSSLSHLHYSADYVLSPFSHQVIEGLENQYFHFQMKEEKINGHQCEGHLLHKTDSFKQKKLWEKDILFTQLKKMENLFIRPQSDPYYKNLIQSLHDHYRKILIYPSTHFLDTKVVLFQARKAIRDFYPQDRLLVLLTANIDFHSRQQKQTQSLACD